MDRSAIWSPGEQGTRLAALTSKFLAVALVIVLPAVAHSVEVAVTSPAGVAGGTSFDYTITVSNPDAAVADVSVIDTLPGELSYASDSGGNWNCSVSGNPDVVTCDFSGSLPTGDTVLTLTVDAEPQAADNTVTNNVAVAVGATEEDTASANTIIYADDLSVTKLIDDGASGAGTLEVIGDGEVSFEITVTNDASVAAPNVQVRDVMPAGFDVEANPLDGFGTDWSCTVSNGAQDTVSCDFDGSPLAASGTTPVLTLTATAPAVEASFDNVAEAQSDGSVSAYPHDSSAATVDVYLESDLRVLKEADQSTVYSGDSVTYTYTLSNLGPHTATGVTLVDTFDRDNAVASFAVSPAADWNCQEVMPAVSGETSISCSLDASESLPPDASNRVVSLAVTPSTVDSAVTMTNQATVTADQRLPATPLNVSAEVEVDLEPSADLSLDRISVPASPIDAESTFSWQLRVDNAGPSLAESLEIVETLPDGVVVTGFSGPWTCSANQRLGQILCTLSQLSASTQSTVTVTGRAPRNPAMPGQTTADSDFGAAAVAAATHDPDPGNNSAAGDSITVAALWDLGLLKDSASTLLVPEQAFTYQIEVTNDGPSDLTGGLRPLLDDVFDSRLRGVFGTCQASAAVPCWSCSWLEQPALDQTVDDNGGSNVGLAAAWPLAISPDGAHVYVGDRFEDAIARLDRQTGRSADFGRLTWAGFNEDLVAPGVVAVHPSGEWLLAIGYGSAAELKVFARNAATGALTETTTFGETFNQAADAVFSADGAHLYVAESGLDRIRHFSFDDAAGALASIGNTVRAAAAANPVLLDGVSGLGLGPEGAALYAAAPGDNAVVAFSVNAATGALTPFTTASRVMDNGSGPVPVSEVVAGTDEVFAGGGDSVFIIARSGPTADLGSATAIVASDVPARRLDGVSGLALNGAEDALFVSAADAAAVSLIQRDGGGNMVFRRSVSMPNGLEANGLVLDGGDERLYVSGTSGSVSGGAAPDSGAVLVFKTVVAGGCDDLRSNEISNDPVDDIALTVPAGQRVVMTIHAAVKAGTPTGSLTNTAELEAALAYGEANPEVQSSSKPLPIRNATKVVATTSAPGQRPIPGSQFEFTVNIINDGPSGVTGLSVTDALPIYPTDLAGFVAGTTGWQCSAAENACCNPGQSQCGVLQPVAGSDALNGHLVNIGAQSSLTFTLRGRLHPSADPEGTVTNQVQLVMPAGIEAFSSDDLVDSHSEDLTPEADVWLDKRSLGTVEDNGDLFVDYEVTVGNFGPSAVRGINLRDPLDDPALGGAGANWSCEIDAPGESTLAANCCDYDSGAGSCLSTELTGETGPIDQDLALAPNGRMLFRLRVPVSDLQAAQVENTALVSVPGTVTDTDPVNNQESLLTRLQATANLDISKEILAGSSVTPGEEVQFLITVTNEGGPDGVPVTVNDLFGPELTDISWTCDATTPIPGDLSYAFDLGLGEDLADASAVATSDDGRHVYALGAGAPGDEETTLPATLAVFERNIVPGPNFGSLVQLELEVEGIDDASDSGLTVEGLTGGRDMVLSPDQRHLYIASAEANAVTVFRREHIAGSEDFGRLSFVQSRALGSDEPADIVSPVTGLGNPTDVAVSADGRHVYVVGRADHAVAIFKRNISTGTLAFEGQVDAFSLGLADGLWGATSIDIAPNDRDVYVTGSGLEAGFSGPDWTATEYDSGTYGETYFVNNTAGVDLKWLTQEQSLTMPTFDSLFFEFEHRFNIDASYGCFDIGVLQYSTDDGTSWNNLDGNPDPFQEGGYNGTQNGYEGNPLNLASGWCSISPGFASGFDTVRVDLTSLVSPGEGLMLRFGLGEGSAVGGTGWWVDNLRLYTVNGGTESNLFQDSVSTSTSIGNVVHLERRTDETAVGFGGLTPRSVTVVESGPLSSLEPAADFGAMDGRGENLYVGDRQGMVVVYQRDASTGSLTRLEVLSLTENPVPGIDNNALDGLSSLAVSEDGEHLVATGQNADRLVVLRRLPFVGTLEAEQMMQPGAADLGRAPGGVVDVRDAVFSADGRHVFTVTGQGQLGVFDRQAPDPTYGFLEAVFDGEDDGFGSTATGLLGARAADLSSDGRWLYAAGFGQVGSGERGSLAVLERDSGATEPGRHLRFSQAFRDLQGGVEGLDGAVDVISVPSSDGLFEDIYVISERDSAIAHFRQDRDTGGASFIGVYRDGLGGVTGLAGGSSITATAPGGNFVFASGRFDHAVAVFSRNPADGSLTPIGEARDGVDGVLGMLGASDLALSRDNAHLYVAARQSDSVVVFEHDAGMLSYRQTFYDGTDGAIVTSPTGIDVTYDAGGGEHVIVTSLDGDAVTVLARESDPEIEALYGRLRFQQSLSSDEPGLEALISPRDVRVDPFNDRVYVAADGGNALIVLDRNTSPGGSQFGQLYPLEVRQQGTAGIIGIDRPYGLAVSGGSRRNIYTAALGSQSIAAFVRRAGSSCAASGGGNLSEEVFIAADGTIRFTVTATVDPSATGTLTNEATLTIGDDVTNTGTNTDDESDPRLMTPSSDLTIRKDNARLSVVAGETDGYRIVIENEGPSHARSVSVSDLLSGNDQFDETTATWSCRAIGSGALRRQSTVLADTGPSAGLAGASSLAWASAPTAAPELGERLYVTGLLGNSLTALSVDPVTGGFLIDAQVEEGGLDIDGAPVSGLRGARDVVVGSEGRFVYVSSQVDDALLIFEIELSDPMSADFGGLRLIEGLSPADPNLESLDQPQGLALSGDGDTLYLTAANSGAIYVFDRETDAGSAGYGRLTWIQDLDTGVLPELGGARQVIVDSDGDHVYVAATAADAIVAFDRAPDGTLTHLQTRQAPAVAGLSGVADLALSPDGDHLYAVGRDSGAVVVFPRDDAPASGLYGRLGTPIQQLDDEPGLVGPRAIVVSDDGGSVYVAAFETNSVLVFRRDRVTGEIETIGRRIDGSNQAGLSGVSSLAFSGNGESLFTGSVLDGAVVRFDRAGFSRCDLDSGTGDVVVEVDVAAGGEIVIDLDVDVFADAQGVSCPEPLDPERQCVVNTVDLNWTETAGSRSVSASDASFLAAAARLKIEKSDSLAEFRGLAGARAIAGTEVLGSHLYVAAPGEPGLGVYALTPSTGPTGAAPLSFEQLVPNGQGPVSSLNGVSDILVSPDGRHVYASSSLDNAIVAFEREAATGRLTWLATYSNNASGVIGLSGARSLAMDSQGRHLYVAGTNGNAVVVFDRAHEAGENDYGELSFRGLVQNGTDGVVDLLRPVHLSLSPDDRHLYVAATQSDAVVVFSRNADSLSTGFGDLQWRQSRRNLIGAVSGLLDVSHVLVSPDGATLYASGTGNSAIVRFSRNTDSTESDFGRLSFENAVTGIEGLGGVGALRFMGSSAEWLVAASRLDNALVLFERSPVDGSLQLNQTLADAPELAGASDLWADASGSRLHVAAANADAVSVYDLAGTSLALDGAMVQGGGGAVPGGDVIYLITVVNEGPSRVVDARVTDFFPDVFDSVAWSCQIVGTAGGGSSCPNSPPGGSFSGNVDALISLAAGDSVRIEATGTLRPDATGDIVNTARVEMPAGIVDLGGGNNVAIDDDTTINSRSDLRIEFDNPPAEVVAGETFDLRVRVHNDGPGALSGSRVAVELPEALVLEDWICQPNIEPGLLELAGQTTDGLDLGRAAALSRDGRHVYVAGTEAGQDALTVFTRDPLTGDITLRQQLFNLAPDSAESDAPIIDGLAGGIDILVSPDDAHVYVAGRTDDAVAQFERDGVTGKLSFIGVVRDEVGAVDGLAGVRALAMSADGSHLYAAGELDDAVAALERDPATGELSFQQVRRNQQNGVARLDAPVDLLLLDDGGQLWVAARDGDAIVRFGVDADGSLTSSGFFEQGGSNGDGEILDGLDGIRSLAQRADGVVVALARSAGVHALSLFDRPQDDVITLRVQLSDGDSIGTPAAIVAGLAGGDSVVVDPVRNVIYVGARDGGSGLRTVSAFVEDADSEAMQYLGTFDGGSGTAEPVQPVLGADGRQLYLLGGDSTDRFRVLAGSTCERLGERQLVDTVDLIAGGLVTYDLQARVMPNARGAFELMAGVSPRMAGDDFDLANNTALVTVPIRAESMLAVDKTLQTDPVVAGEDVTWRIAVSNDGPSSIRDIVVSDFLPTLPGNVPEPGAPGVIAGSAQWQCTGADPLTVGVSPTEGPMTNLRAMAVSEDGLWAAVAGPDAATLWLYARNAVTGNLVLADSMTDGDEILDDNDQVLAEVAGLAGASDIAFSRDAGHLYVVSESGDSITSFELDADSSSLSYNETRSNAESTIAGLDGPVRIVPGPADDRLYVGSRGSSAIAVFDRDPVDGGVVYRQSVRSGIGLPLNVLDGVRDLAISPDGAHLYAAAAEFNAIVGFEIDGDGELSYIGHLANGDSQGALSVVGLGLVQSLVISPQGRHIYAASLADDSVTLIARDAASGSLNWQWQLRNGQAIEGGLDGASALHMSGNGQYLYAGARNETGIVVFERDWTDGNLTDIDRLQDPSLNGVRRLAGDDAGLLSAVESIGGELATLKPIPAGFCGSAADSAVDQLIDSISLAPGARVEYLVTAMVHPGARGVLVNSAEAVLPADVTGLTPAEQTGTAQGPIDVVTDLDVVKTIGSETTALVAGGTVGFLIDLANIGPSHGFAVTVTDLLPGVLSDVSWTCETIPAASTGSSCPSSGSGDIDETVDLLVGERLLFQVDGVIDPAFLGQLSNTASVFAPFDGSDPDLDNNESTVSGTVNFVSDIQVSKTASVADAAPGQSLTYEITVINAGPSDAASVNVADVPPAGLNFEAWACAATDGNCAASGAGAVNETVAIDAGGQVVFIVDARVDAAAAIGSVLVNQASASLGGEGSDPIPGNDVASASITVREARADIEVTKTVDFTSALPGDVLGYDISVSNLGPNTADAVEITDTMPAGLLSAAWTCQGQGGASCVAASGPGDLAMQISMPAGSSLSFAVTGQIDPGLPASPDEVIVNTASATMAGQAIDPEPDNNSDSAETVLDLDVMFRDRFQAPVATQESP